MRDLLSIERATTALQGRRHNVALQSLRGLAALVVVIHHSSFYYAYDPGLKHWSEILLNAHAAVVFFFVLSGFVLTGSLARTQLTPKATVAFYARRAFRIYPGLWFACLLGFGYVALFRNMVPPAYVVGLAPDARHAPSTAMILATLAGVKASVPVPVWTLFVELVASALMPFFAWVLFKRTRYFPLLLVAFVVLSQAGHLSVGTLTVAVAPLYLVDFVLGASIILLAPALESALSRNFVTWSVAALGFATLWFGRNLFVADFALNYGSPPAALTEAVGATILITVVHSRPDLFSPLRWLALAWLGDISYSLYLVHQTILSTIAAGLGERLHIPPFTGQTLAGTVVLMLATLCVSLVVAAFAYRFIELPAIRLGKRLTSERTGLVRQPSPA